METTTELLICDDCLMVVANGDTSGIAPERVDHVLDSVEALGLHVVPGDDTHEFTRHGCDCCDEWRAGRRHQAFILT